MSLGFNELTKLSLKLNGSLAKSMQKGHLSAVQYLYEK